MAHIAIIGLTGQSLFFSVPRFHAGGETVHADGFHSELGGKGCNQAVAAARQGAEVSFLTAVGEDDVEMVRRFLSQEGIKGYVVGKKGPSAHAAILTDAAGETRVTVARGAELDTADVEAGFRDAIASADILLLNNEVPDAVNLRASEIAEANGVKVMFNPAPARPVPETLKRRVFLWTPNEFEEAALGDVPGEVVTTLGAKGCHIRSTGEVIPAPSADAVDSTGAGDTFTGVLAVRLLEGEALAAACRAANEAAAQCVAARYVIPAIPRRSTFGCSHE